MRISTGLAAAVMTTATLSAGGGRAEQPSVPLCPGLTIVTAVAQADGDYESIKIIEAVTDDEVRLRYSTERMVSDLFSIEPPKLERTTMQRTVRRVDLESAILYLQQFSTLLPELVPETTALGTSAAVLNALKTKGEAELGIFIAFAPPNRPPADRNVHPNVYSNQMIAPITRVGDAPVMMPLLVNDRLVELPAIHARGDFYGDKSEFFFLDDPANPLTLKFRFGIDDTPLDPDVARALNLPAGAVGDRDVLRVIKIAYECGGPPDSPADPGEGQAPAVPGGDGAGLAGSTSGAALEKALAETGRADIYSLYFSFNSDAIREESEPILAEIAGVLARNPEWTLAINGHTDDVGGDQYNLALSQRRAAAVKVALVTRHGVATDRLTTAGMGRSQPKDTNETLEGRAHNRRVELIRR
jgi:outer membrane protein OmpA-like peptidoglycan-associated protein